MEKQTQGTLVQIACNHVMIVLHHGFLKKDTDDGQITSLPVSENGKFIIIFPLTNFPIFISTL